MLRQAVLVTLLVSAVVARPQQPDAPESLRNPFQPQPRPDYPRTVAYNSQIVRSENVNKGPEGYQWGYENDDGQTHDVVARYEKAYPGFPEDALEVKGTRSFVDGDGKKVFVEYTSGVNGYRETRKFV